MVRPPKREMELLPSSVAGVGFRDGTRCLACCQKSPPRPREDAPACGSRISRARLPRGSGCRRSRRDGLNWGGACRLCRVRRPHSWFSLLVPLRGVADRSFCCIQGSDFRKAAGGLLEIPLSEADPKLSSDGGLGGSGSAKDDRPDRDSGTSPLGAATPSEVVSMRRIPTGALLADTSGPSRSPPDRLDGVFVLELPQLVFHDWFCGLGQTGGA